MTTATPAPAPARRREWAPRMWQGCHAAAWLRLLERNRFAVEPPYWYIAAIVTVISAGHTAFMALQEAMYGAAIRRTRVRHAPLFILGHWRSGTTWLHELLIRDPRHTYPTTYECFEPNHFLLTEELFRRYGNFLAPDRRPMDNMAAGWDRPQEDEFALCMMGLPSPYLGIAFPRHPVPHREYLDLEHVPPARLRDWKRALHRFVQTLTYKDGRRLVLKSPPHTARVRHLLEVFPDARFVHIVRDPYVLYPSTVKLWRTLYRTHGLQKPMPVDLEEYVFETFTRMYKSFEASRGLIPPGRLYEVRYEDLVADPLGQLEAIYRQLDLGDFAEVRPAVASYLEGLKDYEPNRHDLTPAVRGQVTERWGEVIRRWGYDRPTG
jgi:hypothetical protein